MKKKNTFNKYNSIQSIRPKAQTGKINPGSLLDGLSGQERQQAYIRAVDLGLIQTGFTNDPAVIEQQNAAVEQMLQQEASQNSSIPQGPPTPPQGGASPGMTPSGGGSGMGGVNAQQLLQQKLVGNIANTNVTSPSGGGGLGNQNDLVSMTPRSGYLPSGIQNIGDTQLAGGGRSAEEIQGQGKLGISQIANAAKMFFPDPKSDPSIPEIDTNDPNFNLNSASSEYNQFLNQMKKVDGTTDGIESLVNSFAGGNNTSKANDIAGQLKGKEGLLGKAGKFAGKIAGPLAGMQFIGGAMEGFTNDQDPTTYKPLEIASDVLQLKFGDIYRQSKQRKEYKKLEEEARNKKVEAGLENSRMQTDAAVNQKYTGQTYNYNTGPQTRFNYKSGGTKKLRGGQQIDLGRPDVGAVMFKGATHKDGGIDHENVEVEDKEVYTKLKIKNPNTGKTENAGYYYSEYLKDSNGKSFAEQALAAINKGGTSKNLKKELSNIAKDNETAAKNTGEMNRDKNYIARYGGLKRKAQTGKIQKEEEEEEGFNPNFEKAGLTVSNTMDLGAPGIKFIQKKKGSGMFGDADLSSFKTRFKNPEIPEYLRNSAEALMPADRNSVGQFQTDYNQYLGEIYDSNPSLSENLNRDEFITSQGFQYNEADGPYTIDRDFGEHTSTRPIYTKTPKKEEIPEEIPEEIEIPEESSGITEESSGIDKRLTEIKRNRFSGKDIVPFGQLVPPLYTLMDPYDKLKGASITPGVQLPRMPRVNLEGDKADNRNRTATSFEAMRQAGLDPGSSGVAGNVNTAASDTSTKVAGAENDANKSLAGQETNARLQASMFNTKSLTSQKEFNKRLEQIENQYGREEKLAALDSLFERIQGIQNAKDQKKALDNYIDVLDEYDSLERKEEVRDQQKARNKAERRGIKTSEYWIETENRYMTDLEIRTEVAKIFPSLPLPQKEEKKRGGYYIGRMGALKNRK